MIIEIPVLCGSPPPTGNVPFLTLYNERFVFTFDEDHSIVFQCVLPNTYLGNSLDIKLYWLYSQTSTIGVAQDVTWGIQIQRLEEGDIITDYSFSPQATNDDSATDVGAVTITTVNIPVGDLQEIEGGDLFRLRIKLVNRTVNFPLLTNVIIDNGP